MAGPLGGGNDGIGRRTEDDPNLVVPPLVSRSSRGHAQGLSMGHNTDGHLAIEHSAVRRLTPVECERLQALPDNWTRVPADAPDSRRYAALGDAVTASVAEWIGRRILQVAA